MFRAAAATSPPDLKLSSKLTKLLRMDENKPFHTKKSLGQHFLNSDLVPGWLADAATLAEGETVVEIGPGTGALTKELLRRGAKVIALEADHRAIERLEEDFPSEIETKQLIIKHADVRHFTLEELELPTGSFKVVANIPYYLSGLLFRNFLSGKIQPNTLVFLVQKEVAKRVCSNLAKGDKSSLLSLAVEAFGQTKYVKAVSAGHFTPPPKVDSAIVLVSNINRDHFKNLDQEFFFSVLHLGFGQKRKQLLGNLAKEFSRSQLATIFNDLNISEQTRAEDLDLKSWLALAKKLSTISA